MKGRDEIKELFSDKLGGYEAKVNPNLWNNIASQIGTTAVTTATTTGLSIVSKWLIGIASAVAVTAIVVVNSSDATETNVAPKENQVAENNTVELQANIQMPDMDHEVTLIPTPNNASVEEEASEETDYNSGFLTMEEIVLPPDLEENPETNEVSKNNPEKNETKEAEETKNKPSDEGANSQGESSPDEVIIANQSTEQETVSYEVGELPNVFSPNGDGANDVFEIWSKGLTEFSVAVLNDKGKSVFQSNDPNFRWDGNSLSGDPVPVGRYIYYVIARDGNGNLVKKGNSLTINR